MMSDPLDGEARTRSVTVLAFGGVAELLGRASLELAIADECAVSELVAALVARFPALGARRELLRVAVNRKVAVDTDRIRPGDEVALIPPVAGG